MILIVHLILYILLMRVIQLFIRTEKSVKDFIYFYPIVSILIVINILLWFIVYVVPTNLGDYLFYMGAGHNYSVHEYGEYWRIITPIFLHGDFMHTIFNSFSLVLFGPALEQMLGKFKFPIAYLATGIIGNIGTYLVEPMSTTIHIGASGAIYGIFGIYIFMILFRKHLIDSGNAQIVKTIFLIGLVMTFVSSGINIFAHIFGFIGGVAIGPLILNNVQPFSVYRNPKRTTRTSSGVQFDPNRWNKRRFRIPPKVRKNLMWIIIGGLVILGLFGRFF